MLSFSLHSPEAPPPSCPRPSPAPGLVCPEEGEAEEEAEEEAALSHCSETVSSVSMHKRQTRALSDRESLRLSVLLDDVSGQPTNRSL